jgi:glucan phosphoethanolaminetransferase (alkaline phosphatase superfamily)
VLIPDIYLLFYGSDFEAASIIKSIAYIGFFSILFLFPSLFLKARTFFLISGLFVLVAPIEIGHIFLNRMPSSSAYLLSIIETNSNELMEVVRTVAVPLIAYGLLCIFYFYIVFAKIRNEYFISSKKIRCSVLAICIFALLSGYVWHWTFLSQVSTTKDAWIYAHQRYLKNFCKTWPYGLIMQIENLYSMQLNLKKSRELVQNFRFDAKKAQPVEGKEVYVLVIGETGRYSSWSLNGYERETSPLLSKTPNLVSYTNLFSEANVTYTSLWVILTRANALNLTRYYREKSMVDAFQEAGFKTYWIANQSASNPFIRRIADDADGKYFSVTDFDAADNYDENLWIPMQQFLSQNDEKVLIVLHTLGSHFRYNFRYPANFEKFTPGLRGAFNLAAISKENRHLFVNSYDNSILYTDYFLASTIQKIDSLQAVSALIYLADHGENLSDTDKNISLHAGLSYSKYDFHIPFFVWTSEQYRRQYPEKTAAIIANKDKKLSASHLFDSFLDMAGITYPEQRLDSSIASGSLREDSVRYIINTNMEVRIGY